MCFLIRSHNLSNEIFQLKVRGGDPLKVLVTLLNYFQDNLLCTVGQETGQDNSSQLIMVIKCIVKERQDYPKKIKRLSFFNSVCLLSFIFYRFDSNLTWGRSLSPAAL